MPSLDPFFILAILIALSVHEWAHAFVADKLGDPTARYSGRLTLNPIAHLDPLGTLLFVMVGFGWGKPVPVDPGHFRHPKRDSALVSVAGPLSNLLLAVIGAACFTLVRDVGVLEGSTLQRFLLLLLDALVKINLVLMAFNLLPIAPLDGSKILGAFIPLRYEDQYDEFLRMGPWILLVLLLGERLLNIPFLGAWIGTITLWVMHLFGSVGMM